MTIKYKTEFKIIGTGIANIQGKRNMIKIRRNLQRMDNQQIRN